MAHLLYLALGSNLGNRLNFLQSALDHLAKNHQLIQASSIYESEPWGFADQGSFLNMVVSLETDFSPRQVLNNVKKIERDVGRKPTFKNGPREIDIDILLYDQEIIYEKNLMIPHAGIAERVFVIKPLAEINAEGIEPISGKRFSELLKAIDTSSIERKTEMEIHLESIDNR